NALLLAGASSHAGATVVDLGRAGSVSDRRKRSIARTPVANAPGPPALTLHEPVSLLAERHNHAHVGLEINAFLALGDVQLHADGDGALSPVGDRHDAS